MSFLFWFLLAGLIVASLQDFKRREVDNWLNLLLLVGGFGFLIFSAVFNYDANILILGVSALVFMVLIESLLYYGHVFGGGDAKLLVAMFAFFVGASFWQTISNIGLYVILLLVAGSLYGLVYSFSLVVWNYKKVKPGFKKEFKNIYFRYMFFGGIVLFVLSYVNFLFLLPAVFVLFGSVLWVFGRAVENTIMIKEVEGSKLREGDLLAENVNVKGRTINVEWEGLSLDEIKKLKGRKVKIKDGIPFAFSFLIAFLIYVFAGGWILKWLGGLI